MNDTDLKKVNSKLKAAILKVLLYIEEVIDDGNEKELSIIKEELEDSALLFHSHIRGEAKPPRDKYGLFSEMSPWKRRIRLLAENMSRINLNLKKILKERL